MARKPPIPAIPPVPSRRPSRSAAESHLVPAQTAPPKQSQHPELPDLLEAFWGEESSTRGAIPCARGRRGARPDPE
jgi:hypothetical protein